MALYSTKAVRDMMRGHEFNSLRIKEGITDGYRKIIADMLYDIVSKTPQYTGNLAQAWQLVFGPHQEQDTTKYSSRDRDALRKVFQKFGVGEPYKRGDNPAVREAMSRELDKLPSLRWNTTVRIVNNQPYAEEVGDGEGPNGMEIREENLWRGSVYNVERVAIKYSRMNTVLKIVAK